MLKPARSQDRRRLAALRIGLSTWWVAIFVVGAVVRAQPPGAGPTGRPASPLRAVGPMAMPGSIPTPFGFFQGGGRDTPPPGEPTSGTRPRPGSLFNPGASGPGINQSGDDNFLDGALDPATGWPFVFLDHFAPRPDRVERFWIVSTRDCPQVMGSDPWSCLKVQHFDAEGRLITVDPVLLFAQAVGHPVFIQVQGNLTTPDSALGGLLWSHSWLQRDRAMPPDTVVIAFDWPSQRVDRLGVRDVNEKGRRSYVAGFHLARFVQGFPPSSRICLLGQSFGGRVVPSALHLLGGGCLNSQAREPEVRLPWLRPDLNIHAVILAGASDRNWLNPGARLDRALHSCSAFLNLYNGRDEALQLYPLLRRSGHHHAIGKLGLTNRDFKKLGPLAARYEEHNVDAQLGREHTLLDAVANRQIARWIAPYLWAPDPGPLPPREPTEPRGDRDARGLRSTFRRE
ncbi:MAG: hypothetical protein ABI353_04905 [Isosphaeraceae bacterium]